MKIVTLFPKVTILSIVAIIVLSAATLLIHAETPLSQGLSIDRENAYAIYRQGEEGSSLHIVFTIVNDGPKEATIVTENFCRGLYGIDKDTNSLRCTLNFWEPSKYKEKYSLAPSIYKSCPVTLKPGEAMPINYFSDRPKAGAINYRPCLSEENLKAENIIVTYEIPSSWGTRLDLWQGKIQSAPIKLVKRISEESK